MFWTNLSEKCQFSAWEGMSCAEYSISRRTNWKVNRYRSPLSNARVNAYGEALVECGIFPGSSHEFVHDVNTAEMSAPWKKLTESGSSTRLCCIPYCPIYIKNACDFKKLHEGDVSFIKDDTMMKWVQSCRERIWIFSRFVPLSFPDGMELVRRCTEAIPDAIGNPDMQAFEKKFVRKFLPEKCAI